MLSYYVPDEERDVIQHVNQNKESSLKESAPSVFMNLVLKFNSGLQQPNVSKCFGSVSNGFLYALETCFVVHLWFLFSWYTVLVPSPNPRKRNGFILHVFHSYLPIKVTSQIYSDFL